MAKLLNELRERLLRAGVAPRHVRRYLTELTDHLADLTAEEKSAGRCPAEAESAAIIRLGTMEDLSKAMIEQREFQSWCVRVPWAMFGLAPLGFLAGAYLVACLILWSGWYIFLPGEDTPFVRISGFASFYFGLGRWLYFGAPILIGWAIAIIAARQRLIAIWPVVGLVVIALIGATAQVHASRPAVPGGVGNISMSLAIGPSAEAITNSLFRASVILLFMVLPWLVWQLKEVHSLRVSRRFALPNS